ncbi:MAG TPA: SAM-dependent methyltransferase [Gammaproteobacteria bacterium]|jgi:predicted methyltransferase
MNGLRRVAGFVTVVAAGVAIGFQASAELAPGFDAALMAAERPAEEKERDAMRRPRQVLEFVGIDAGMTVLEVFAGGGWYTEVLSAAVGPEGTVYSQNTARFAERFAEASAARAERLGNVIVWNHELGSLELDDTVDAAFTALNLHDAANDSEEAGVAFLTGVYGALKPGGVFGLIDHVGIAGQDNAELHRIERARVLQLLEQAGFTVEAESDVLANSADNHTLNVRDESLGRNTDRMLIRARKPQ